MTGFAPRRVLVLLVVLCAALLPAQAQDESSALERRVKAAFLYKFTGYVDWPAGTFLRPDSPVTIGVMGEDQLAAEAAQLVAGRTLDGRPLQVRRVTPADLAAGGVHILFIGGPDALRLGQIVKALPAAPMLIVSESPGALRQGSIVNFVVVDGRVRFDVSLEAAERRGLRLSSRLLAVAKSVQ